MKPILKNVFIWLLSVGVIIGLFPGCGESDSNPQTDAGQVDAGGSDAGQSDASQQCQTFQPYEIEVTANPNGLYYDKTRQVLYIADDNTNKIYKRTEAGVFSQFAEIPLATGNTDKYGLGDMDMDPNGNLYAPRFGGNPGLGGIFKIAPDGTLTEIPGVNSDWRRIGLDYDDTESVLFVATFNKDSDGKWTGWISKVDPVAGTEQVILEGFQKPVGVLKIGNKFLVADQKDNTLYVVDLSQATKTLIPLINDIPGLDVMDYVSDEIVLITAYDETRSKGSVWRIDLSGNKTLLHEGDFDPQGITFDGVSRIFVSLNESYLILVIPAC